jgi:hypothetical protein
MNKTMLDLIKDTLNNFAIINATNIVAITSTIATLNKR